PVIQGDQQSLGEEEITEEHTRLVGPELVDAQYTSALLCLIDHIIMEQCGGMKKLDRGGGNVTPLRDLPEHARGHEDQGGPDLLSFLPEEILDDLVQQVDIAVDGPAEKGP